MAILIKGMEMPRGCDDCGLKSNGYCDITNRLIPYDGSRHGYCPLVEVPDAQTEKKSLNGDVVYRQDVLDALGDEPEVWSGKDEYDQGLNNQWHYDRNAILAVSPAQSEQRWIPVTKEQILQAGYEGREVRFHIGGRLFAIRELAQ